MSWTEEKVNKLKELWGKGQTASQIAEIIGGISRNAVIGKAHRLNLSAKIKTRSAVNLKNSQKNNEISTAKRGRKSKFRSLLLDIDFEPAKTCSLRNLLRIPVSIWRGIQMRKIHLFVEEKLLKSFPTAHFI